jgi:hypothetical protein
VAGLGDDREPPERDTGDTGTGVEARSGLETGALDYSPPLVLDGVVVDRVAVRVLYEVVPDPDTRPSSASRWAAAGACCRSTRT